MTREDMSEDMTDKQIPPCPFCNGEMKDFRGYVVHQEPIVKCRLFENLRWIWRTEEWIELLRERPIFVKQEIAKLKAERDELKDERDELLVERAEAVEIHSRIMSEQCPTDEQHCTCVPALMAEVERLNKAVDVLGKYPGGWDEVFMASYETAQKLRAENERLRAALENLVKAAQIVPNTFLAEYHEQFYYAMREARAALEVKP